MSCGSLRIMMILVSTIYSSHALEQNLFCEEVKKSKKLICLSLAMVAIIASAAYSGTYSGGMGEPNNPYLIADANDMNETGTHPED